MFPLTTTLKRIADCNPCLTRWEVGMAASGKSEPDDEPISYEAILDAVGLDDALWCCQAEPQHAGMWRCFAVWCARHVQHLMTDQNSIAVLDVAERHANGDATDQELAEAFAAAFAAAFAFAAAAASASAASANAAFDAAFAAANAFAAAFAAPAEIPTAAATATAAAAKAVKAGQSAAFRQLVTTGTLPALEQRLEAAA